MALAALVLLAVLVVVVVVLAVRQVRLGVQHERTRLLVDALDARVGGVQRRLEEVPGIGTGRHEVALVLNPIKTNAGQVRRELERLVAQAAEKKKKKKERESRFGFLHKGARKAST